MKKIIILLLFLSNVRLGMSQETAPCPCLTNSGVTNMQSFMLFLPMFSKTGLGIPDLNEDGIVNIGDMLIILGSFGQNCTELYVVIEENNFSAVSFEVPVEHLRFVFQIKVTAKNNNAILPKTEYLNVILSETQTINGGDLITSWASSPSEHENDTEDYFFLGENQERFITITTLVYPTEESVSVTINCIPWDTVQENPTFSWETYYSLSETW